GRWGDEEKRAVACGVIAGNLASQGTRERWDVETSVTNGEVHGRTLPETLQKLLGGIKTLLTDSMPAPKQAGTGPEKELYGLLDGIIRVEWNQAEQDWQSVAASLAPRCIRAVRDRSKPGESSSLLDAGFELLFFNPTSQKERLTRDI